MVRGFRRAGAGTGLLLLLLLGVGSPPAGRPAGAGAPAGEPPRFGDGTLVLIRIATDDGGMLDRLSGAGIAVVAAQDGYALAWGPAAAVPRIRALGLGAESLTERREDRAYAVVFTDGGGRAGRGAPLESLGRVLRGGPHTAVLEYPVGKDQPVWESYPIVPIGDRPILRPPAAPLFRIRPPTEADPGIAAALQQVDATGLQEGVQALQDFGTRRSESPQAREAQQSIHDLFLSYGLTDVSDFDYNSWCDDVVAVQPGRVAPEEIYVIGAHYDSFAFGGFAAPGADDNATGTVGVLEAARVLAPQDFEATIIYIAFSGEEQGLVGSRAWAEYARGQNLDIRAMLNLDMLGYLSPGGTANLDLINREESNWLRDFIIQTAAVYLPDYSVIHGFLSHGDSDHTPFSQNGYYSIFFFEDSYQDTPYIHTTNDVVGLSANNFDFMRRNVQVAIASLATLARPLRVQIDHTPLPDPPITADGYRVLAKLHSNAPIQADSSRVRYAVDRGDFISIPMAPAPEGAGWYAAAIPKQDPGRFVQYVIHAQDNEGRTGQDPVQGAYGFIVGLAPVFADGFDTDKGWTVTVDGDPEMKGRWVRAVPVWTGAQPGTDADGDSSGLCYVTGNGLPGGDEGEADVDGGRTILTSPRFDLTGAMQVRIEYERWFVDETRPDDTLRVYLSSDDGAEWRLIESVGRSERKWTKVLLGEMGTFPPPTDRMRIRFDAEDVGGASLVEAAIDNVVVYGVTIPPEPANELAGIVRIGPLPLRPGSAPLRILYDLKVDGAAAMAVYDLQGRRIAHLTEIPSGSGWHETTWDGRDAEGRAVAAGVYFLRLEIPGGSGNAMRVPVVP